MQARILRELLVQTWASPVFGDSFPARAAVKTPQVMDQIEAITSSFAKDLAQRIASAEPGYVKVTKQITAKTVVFCPALAAGELQATDRLSAFAVAIGLMYWSDQTMDRGDESMPYAIELAAGQTPDIPAALAKKARLQAAALAGIAENVDFFALPEDQALVLDCFLGQVLLNEVYVQRLSQAYMQKSGTDKEAFLDQHGKQLARRIVVDAGFPSVSSSLYALYRQEQKDLPSLQDVYADKSMRTLLQICNVVVRLIDELGDWQTDAGLHPQWGVFNINPFNQPNIVFVSELLKLGNCNSPELLRAVQQFQVNGASAQQADYIITTLLDHVKAYIHDLPPSVFDQYVVLCKRVLEIGFINRVGDIALGSTDRA